MAGMPIKFRCYQCNQLLGVSRSRSGKVVNCPKCGSDLIVPDSEEAPAGAGPTSSAEATPAFLAALDAGVPIELADLRPEDIRVQSEDDWRPPPINTGAPRPAPAPEAPPEIPPFLAPVSSAAAGRAVPYDIESMPTPLVGPPPVLPPEVAPTRVVGPVPPAPPAAAQPPAPPPPLVPPIRVEPPSLGKERASTMRARDIVLPRSVVASWSLLVLVAQALAFIAGLLAGHYVWRVH
jgi:hypothetical protein